MEVKKVFVGVSGGVDSSVALAMLKSAGYEVTGVFLKVWSPDFLSLQSGPSCDWREERRSAMRVCATLDVPFMTIDCEEEYKREVVDYMISEYSRGRVPNPDIFCNKYVKFGVFLKKALEMGADYVATGHYAEVRNNNGTYELFESVDGDKDQSYFLYTLSQEQLKHVLFPVGGMTKPEVRRLAEKFGLPTATKKDSQGLCFLGKIDMKEFLSHYIVPKRGNVLNTKGDVIGYHDGSMFLTIGQRHGFTITEKTANDPRYFIVAKDQHANTVTVAARNDAVHGSYSAKAVTVNDLHFITGTPKIFPCKMQVRIRYRQEKQDCVIDRDGDRYSVTFDSPQSGVAEGQSAVLYDGNRCVGGGIIESVL